MIRVRFAPSPTGNLHIGTLRTALFSWLFAKRNKGKFVLRIEDTDQKRSQSVYEDNIYKGLEWFGLTSDESPLHGGNYGPYRQSERMTEGLYQKAVQKLLNDDVAYYCFCTEDELNKEREQSKEKNIPYVYSRKALLLSKEDIAQKLKDNTPYTIRFKIPDEDQVTFTDLIKGEISFDVSLIGDFVLMKSDGSPSYNFAVVVDDSMMEISHVIRGEDHISNTPKQILLFQALDAQLPKFAHLPMILGPDKAKLSKRHAATAITDYESLGFLPEAFFNYLSLLGWSSKTEQELFTKDELVSLFSFEGVSKSNAIFDIDKATWMNGQYIRKLTKSNLRDRLVPFLTPSYKERLQSLSEIDQENTVIAIVDNLERLDQVNDYIDVFLQAEEVYQSACSELSFSESDKTVLSVLKSEIETNDVVTRAAADSLLEKILAQTGFGKGKVFKPIRFALTAKKSGPHISDILTALPSSIVLKRLALVLS
jgi:nondiscriminating glutamyl-tRNA synthetase